MCLRIQLFLEAQLAKPWMKREKQRSGRRARLLASKTYIHGIPEVVEAQSTFSRSAWLLVLFACLTCLIAQIEEVMVEFINDSPATLVSIAVPTSFPAVLLCPYFRVSKPGVVEDGLYDYILGYFPHGPARQRTEALRHFYDLPELHNITGVKLAAEAMLKAYGWSLDNLLQNITLDPEEVIKKVTTIPPVVKSRMRKLVTWKGICYEVQIDHRLHELNATTLMIYLQVKDDVAFFDKHLLYRSTVGSVDQYGNSPSLANEVYISKSTINVVRSSFREINRYAGRSGLRCRPYSTSDRSHCVAEAFNKIMCQGLCKIPVLPTTSYPEVIEEHMCNLFDKATPSCLETELESSTEVEARCPLPCSERVHVIVTESLKSNNTVVYNQIFVGTNTIIKEHPKITFVDFLSNLGGTTGLWFGISVVSIVQAVVILLFPQGAFRDM